MKNQINNYIDGTSALKIDNIIYKNIADNHKNVRNILNEASILPISSSIYSVQQLYLDLTEQDEINIVGININFSNDEWDFSGERKAGKAVSVYSYSFENENKNLSAYYKTLLKLYVMYSILEYGLHKSSIKNNFYVLKTLFSYMCDNNILSIERLTPEICEKCLDNQNIKYNTKVKKKSSIKNFLVFYSLIANDIYTNELRLYLEDRDTDKIKALEEVGKTTLLPTDFYKKYSDLLYDFVFDDSQMILDRGYAGLLFIGTQTGLRATELGLLENNCLEEQQYKDTKIGILNYRSTKNGGTKSNIYNEGATNANERVINIIKELQNLFDDSKNNDNLLVYMNDSERNTKNKSVPIVSSAIIERFNRTFCIKYRTKLNTLNREDIEDFECYMDFEYMNKVFPGLVRNYKLKENDTISCPSIRQFRVYFASELHERGIDYRTIPLAIS